MREGEPADALWVLVTGSLAVTSSSIEPGGDLPDVVAPAYVGEIGLLRGVPRTATVTTREAATLLRIDGATFLDALETAPPSAAFTRLTGVRWARTQPATGT